ncbi:MAG TPA: hypothetical protein VFZ61_09670, partial [Polyangiales bacterium]
MSLLLPALLGIACSDSHGNEDINDELRDYVRDTNAAAKQACEASDAEIEADDDTPAAACYYALSAQFDQCDRKAFRAHPSEARALLHCLQRDRDALIACCTKDGACSYEKIEHCYDALWAGDYGGACDADTDEIADEINDCLEDEGWTADGPDPCEDVTRRAISWSDPSGVVTSPAQSFALLEGSCSVNYRLDFRYFADEIKATPTTVPSG